jgi:hypothetical protein
MPWAPMARSSRRSPTAAGDAHGLPFEEAQTEALDVEQTGATFIPPFETSS